MSDAALEIAERIERCTTDGDDWEHCLVCSQYVDQRAVKPGHRLSCELPALIAALRAAREPDTARSALEEIRRQLNLRLPSEQTGPEWEQCVRVPITRMTAIDAVLASALGEPTITNEPMPPLRAVRSDRAPGGLALEDAIVTAAVAYRRADRWSKQGPALAAITDAVDAYVAYVAKQDAQRG